MVKETVEAEITSVLTLQRARDAESQAGNRQTNGPLRAQGTAGWASPPLLSILRREAYVTCRGYVGIPQKRAAAAANSRWHRG